MIFLVMGTGSMMRSSDSRGADCGRERLVRGNHVETNGGTSESKLSVRQCAVRRGWLRERWSGVSQKIGSGGARASSATSRVRLDHSRYPNINSIYFQPTACVLRGSLWYQLILRKSYRNKLRVMSISLTPHKSRATYVHHSFRPRQGNL
jgi:hypothetical protein